MELCEVRKCKPKGNKWGEKEHGPGWSCLKEKSTMQAPALSLITCSSSFHISFLKQNGTNPGYTKVLRAQSQPKRVTFSETKLKSPETRRPGWLPSK